MVTDTKPFPFPKADALGSQICDQPTMTNDNIDKYADRVPSDIQRAVKGLAGREPFGIIVFLLKKEGASFTQIKKDLGLHQETLSRALDEMQDGGLVVRYEIVKDDEYDTEYKVTDFGKRVLDSLFDAIQPPTKLLRDDLTYEEVSMQNTVNSVYEVQTSTKSQTTSQTFYMNEANEASSSQAVGEQAFADSRTETA